MSMEVMRPPGWEFLPIRKFPDGDIELWLIILSDEETILGAVPLAVPSVWKWEDGKVNLMFGPSTVRVVGDGNFGKAVVCLVNRSSNAVKLGWPADVKLNMSTLRKGDAITMTNFAISLEATL